MRRIILYICLIIAGITGIYAADNITFRATAPDVVAVGDQFKLSFVISTQNIKDFRAPAIKDFDVLMGPTRSQQSSVQVINGNTSSTNSVTFTYILLATEEGSYTIPGATINAEGNEIISNSVQIKVLPADKINDGVGGDTNNSGNNKDNTTISSSDLFITSNVSKTNVYEQEAILLTYKIYTAIDLRGFDNVKLPDFKGFHSQEIELPDRRWELEHYKGRNYRTTIYRQFILFPQQTGELTIDAARFDASITKANQAIDPFDAFFNGRNSYVEIKKSLFTPKLTINVKQLPIPKPEQFSGGVGTFDMVSSINNLQLKTNDAITLKIVITGTGNLKLVSAPEIQFPDDFEIYDPKIENNSQLTTNGLSGTLTIEYLAIPRNPGTYKIPAAKFSFFDINSQTYKTLTSEEYSLNVEKGNGDASQVIANYSNKENLRVLNEDIRFIKQNNIQLIPRGDYFWGTWIYWLYYIVPLIIFAIFFVLYRRRILENSDIAQVKIKKANKVAVKRMKQAGLLLKNNQKEEFYNEVLRALWGYMSDKLNIPVSKLSKDNIEDELNKYKIDKELINKFINVLNECEYARYAPGDANQAMDHIYSLSLDVISSMENAIKR